MAEVFDEDYFIRGKQTGKSLYENYRWMPELTIPMVCSIVSYLGIKPEDTILDFGCSRGYIVRAFRELGYNAWGCDISKWALDNCDPTVSSYLWHDLSWSMNLSWIMEYDWVIAKDVLEHIPDVTNTLLTLTKNARIGMFAIVPLAHGKQYDVLDYEKDITHIHRQPLEWWVGHFCRVGWKVESCYRVKGIKDNYSKYPTGNGFIVARRIKE